MENIKFDALLRLCGACLLVLTVCLVGFDSQTKVLFYTISRKATFRDLNALTVLVWVDSVAAGYSVLQLLRCIIFPINKMEYGVSYRSQAWLSYFLDQGVVYVVLATNSAATQASIIAVTGEDSFQWIKLCDKYTRFCFQIAGALFCGLIASFLLAVVASISAYRLFRLYSSNNFLHLKVK